VRQHVAQIRGILADQVAVSIPLDPYLSLRALAGYSGLSVRRLRALLEEPGQPIPSFRVGGKILVRRSEFDAWMTGYRRRATGAIDAHVRTLLTGL
jgi:hypothetical protein